MVFFFFFWIRFKTKKNAKQDFSQIWSMISTALTRSADQHGESKGASKLPSTLEIMLDIYTILFPRLPAPLAIEGLEMITHERFLAGPAQKKCYRLLATAVETKAYLTPEKVEALLARVMDIGQDPKRVMGGAKPVSDFDWRPKGETWMTRRSYFLGSP